MLCGLLLIPHQTSADVFHPIERHIVPFKKVVIKKFALLHYIKKVHNKRYIRRNLLKIIAYGETGIYSHPYHTRQGGYHFYGVNYPLYPAKSHHSTAAGKYQITKNTWIFIRKHINLPNFSPKNQNKAAWWLAKYEYRKKTNRSLILDMYSGSPRTQKKILQVLSRVWISLRHRSSLNPRCFLKA